MLNTVQNYVAQQTQAQQQQQSQQMQIDPDQLYTDPNAVLQQMRGQIGQDVQQYVQSVGAPLYQSQAATAKQLSRNDPQHADTWKRWGSEIEGLMSKVPLAQQTSSEVWNQAAKIIQSQHLNEIIAERAKDMAATMGSIEQGGTSTAPGTAAASPDLQRIRESDYGKKHLEGYTDNEITNIVSKTGDTLKQFADYCEGTNVIYHPKKPGELINRDLVRDIES
jgi:hypothetical protein